jgi:hypothetical protein
MAGPSTPLFVRQKGSKAIRIRSPDSLDVQPSLPRPTQPQIPAQHVRSSAAATSKTKDIQKSVGGNVLTGDQYNIYARPFVPAAFNIINTLEGQEFNTKSTKQIDFIAYARRLIGADLLPTFPAGMSVPSDPSSILTDDVIPTQYELYFRHLLALEETAQRSENASYSLFGHEVTFQYDEDGRLICSFEVPGLRENSPYIEEDDDIQIRQLCYDEDGKLTGMDQWFHTERLVQDLQGRHPLTYQHRPAPGWTGVVYNGRVSVVRRKEERLIVRLCDITVATIREATPHLQLALLPLHRAASDNIRWKCNIQFPVQTQTYRKFSTSAELLQKIPYFCALFQKPYSSDYFRGNETVVSNRPTRVPLCKEK